MNNILIGEVHLIPLKIKQIRIREGEIIITTLGVITAGFKLFLPDQDSVSIAIPLIHQSCLGVVSLLYKKNIE